MVAQAISPANHQFHDFRHGIVQEPDESANITSRSDRWNQLVVDAHTDEGRFMSNKVLGIRDAAPWETQIPLPIITSASSRQVVFVTFLALPCGPPCYRRRLGRGTVIASFRRSRGRMWD